MTIYDYHNTSKNDMYLECSHLAHAFNYEEIISEELKNKHHPFVSIIMRTQGRRSEGLCEVLLGLYSQSCQDFEVILIGHKLDAEQDKLVNRIIDYQPEEFKKKIRYYKLDVGGRTLPLNFGFAHARGQYAIILDDDDLILEDWIEDFKKTAQIKSGMIIHSFSFKQTWASNPTEWGIHALRAETAPSVEYCIPYNVISQTYENHCPPVSLAFPLQPFREHGIIFDETLDCAEDWDYLMRLSVITGITDTMHPTSIYRWWQNAESSQTVCNKETWSSCINSVRLRNVKRSYIITPDEIKNYIAYMDEQQLKYQSLDYTSTILSSVRTLKLAQIIYIRLFGDKGKLYRFAVKLAPHLESFFKSK